MNQSNLLIISNKRYEGDFRKYMIRAAARAGSKALHVSCQDMIRITHDDKEENSFSNGHSEEEIYSLVSEYFDGRPVAVLTGFNGWLHPFSLSARRYLTNAIFIYDVYDDFSYGAIGFERARRWRDDIKWRRFCDGTILLGASLKRWYPFAKIINNASHCSHTRDPGSEKFVYIGSIDQRVDFNWLTRLMQTGISLDIYGRIHESKPSAEPDFQKFLQDNPRAQFIGGYDNDQLGQILTQYKVGVVPYKVGERMTLSVHPDKIYHYLNSGLEVLSSKIPHACRLSSYVHLIDTSDDWTGLPKALRYNRKAKDWNSMQNTWDVRWRELSEYVKSLKKYSVASISKRREKLTVGTTAERITPEHPRLHLACGYNQIPNWLNTDAIPLGGNMIMDFTKPFPFEDSSFDAAFCEHSIEHITKNEAQVMCREVYRVLKPQGRFRVVTPSIEKIARLAIEKEGDDAQFYLNWYRDRNNDATATISDAINAMFYSHGHQYLYLREDLGRLLRECGFGEVHYFEPNEYGNKVFDGVDGHGKVIGQRANALETIAAEAVKV